MKKVFFFLAFFMSCYLSAQLRINEILSNNVSSLLDDSYNYSMWVELYNASASTSYNQSNFYFTDNLKVPKKWKPQSKVISAKGYSLLWFERDEIAGHSTIKLNPEGGKLFLLDASAVVIDSVVYPSQYRNISYGRKVDNGSDWVYFEEPSPKASNNLKINATERCEAPVFSIKGGFYTTLQKLDFPFRAAGDTIYYTINGSEPTRKSTRFITGSAISISSTKVIRAKTFSLGKLSSDIATATYFINQRNPHLPVVSIVTENANLFDDMIGIYVAGRNGKLGNGASFPVNWNQDWDRPANFELFDSTGVSRLNQELDIKILGGWSRSNGLKSLAISPKKKFGENSLKYDFFASTKPGRKYKDIQMRNSGNDFFNTMMRDAFMQSIVMHRMDLDYLAYEPAVIFMNGTYYGIENLRERSSEDFMYSNFGITDDITLIEATNPGVDTDKDIATDAGFAEFSSFLTSNDLTDSTVYKQVCDKMDVDEYINYMIPEIYYANTDWPYNNIKMWKKTDGGKWRWILVDTDFGFEPIRINHNTMTFVLGEHQNDIVGYTMQPDWSTVVMRRLILNDTFRNKLIDRFCIHLSTTFETERVNHIMDSISAKISNEISYHKIRWGQSNNFASDLQSMKSFSASRAGNVLNHISNRFLGSAAVQTIHISSNISNASYSLNSEPIIESDVLIKYFQNRPVAIKAYPVSGYRFKQWEKVEPLAMTLISNTSTWKYFDGAAIPSANWSASAFDDASWKTGASQLGYGNKGEVTILGYGDNANNKYPTAYFRKKISIDNLNSKKNFVISTFVDDGAVIYVNGFGVGRANMPSDAITYGTWSTAPNNGVQATFNVPANYLKEGDNIIAAEVHQCNATSSDLIFTLQLTCEATKASASVFSDAVYSGVLDNKLELKAIYEKISTEDSIEGATVLINELVANNDFVEDEFGEKDDYIELYNYGTEEVNIGGWFLTDTPVNQTLTQMPTSDSQKTTIPPKGRVILWSDDQTEQGVLHLGFKLGKDGETVVLSKTKLSGGLMVVDSITYPALDVNMSYSRESDGGSHWVIQAATFAATNKIIDAIKQPEMVSIEIYPTLVTESFTVRNASKLHLTITDITGKILYRSLCESETEVIQAGFLQRGMYVVSIGNTNFKIIKR